jgi:hypothetical protein
MQSNPMHNVFSNKLFSILTVLVFTSSLLFLVAAPFSISSTPTQPRQAHAQESLTTAIGSGLGKGISACLGNLVTQFLIPQTVGKVAGLSFVSPSGLPTTDVGAQIAQGQNAFTQFVREGCLDAIAYFTAQSALDKLSQDTLAWVNSGFTKFGQSGNSAFVGDLEGFYSGVSDQSYNRFIQDITEIEGPNNPLSGVCESFQPQIVRSVSESYFNRNESPSPVEPIQFGSSSEIEATNCEELAESVGTGTVEAFISGEFEQGGWEAFRYTVENPSANPVGAYLEKNKQLKSRVEQATNLNQEKLQRGNGYVSAIACPNGSLDPQTQRCEGPSGEMTEPAVKTPGSVVDEQLNEVIGSGQRQLELADEVNEIVGALTDQLIGKITGTGSSGGPGGVFSQAAQEASYSGNVEEYAEGGYTGGFQANYASSTLADQIELEQDFRAAVEQLPSTDAIDRTRVRAQQCLRNNKLGGPGEVQDTEKLLAQLNAIEDAVFPPAAGSRETEDTQELLEKAEENPDQSVGTSTDGGSGVAKTNWAGEELDWERGTIYGLESCEEGETKYPLTGLGTGNINFSYSNSDNAWLGFVCALNEFDDPTTGSDSIHVDLQPFVQFFDRASDFNRDNPNNESSGSTTVTAEDTENIPKNYESYMNKSGYKEDIAANKVKIDWTGARFDWKFYDLFADKDQLQRVNDGLEYYEDGSYRYQLGFRGNGGTANRYGAQTCREQTQGSISWIIKPGTDQWIQQKCIEDKNGDWQGWAFFNTGETRPAYDTIGTQVTTFQGLIDKIDTLIGDTNYDNLYTAPVSEEDNLRELKHDLTTIDENLGQNESINDRQQKLDRRFGRMQDRFHSEDDIEFASEALQELDGDIDGSVRSQLQTIVENNNCELPDDYVPPTEQRDPDDSGGGGGGGGGSSQPLSIDSFSATREGSSLMTVQWSATALTCYAVDNPDLRAWSGQELPLDGNRSYPVETNQSERLTLRCENTDGESVRQSSFIEPSLEDGFEQSL